MEKFEQRMFANKQAMYYGVFMGLFLVLKFAVDVSVKGTWGAFLSGVCLVLIPIVAYRFTIIFKRKSGCAEEIGFGVCLRFCIYLFFFASMFLAVAQYVYCQHINPNYLNEQVEMVINTLSQLPDSSATVEQFKKALSEVGVPSAATVAIQTIWIYIVVGLILGLPIAAIAKKIKEKG